VAARIQRAIEELRSAYKTIYGERLAQVVLFGSCAWGDADTDSDVDLLVVLKGPVSEQRFRCEQSPLMLNIRCEGIPPHF
jgi:predicted nucleotidyltransferase